MSRSYTVSIGEDEKINKISVLPCTPHSIKKSISYFSIKKEAPEKMSQVDSIFSTFEGYLKKSAFIGWDVR